jgi:hypothetical protein
MAMERIIEGQVVASTAIGRNGDQLSTTELRELFAQLPGERPLNLNHDVRVLPVARAFNTRLDERQDGLLTILIPASLSEEASLGGSWGWFSEASWFVPIPEVALPALGARGTAQVSQDTIEVIVKPTAIMAPNKRCYTLTRLGAQPPYDVRAGARGGP